MKVIEQYTQVHINPMYAVNPADFGVELYYCDIDNRGQLFAKWDEKSGDFALLDFNKALLWQIQAPICAAKIDSVHGIIWLIQRDNDEQVTVFVYDYKGNQKASLMMEDEFGQSGFIITPLPQPMSIALDFANGQDGSQAYFLQFSKNKIQILKKIGRKFKFFIHLRQ